MTIRAPVLADAPQMVDIWNQNVPAILAYAPGSIELLTLASAQGLITSPDISLYVSATGGGTLDGFFFAFRHGKTLQGEEEFSSIPMRLNDLTGTAAQKAAKWSLRLRTTGKALVLAWLQDARARGVAECYGDVPLAAPAALIGMFDVMQVDDAVQPRAGFKRYRATPANAIAGIARIV